jgi:hypothetical protein
MTTESATAWILLTVPTELAEPVADWLMDIAAPGFTGYPVSGHSGKGHGLSLREQVGGRRRGYQYQIEIPAADVANLLAQLRAAFTGSRIRYAVLPVVTSGALHH